MMKAKLTLLAAGCALALSACGNNSSSQDTSEANPAAVATVANAAETRAAVADDAAPMNAGTAAYAATTTAAAAAGAAASDKPTAVVNDCGTEIEANDAMQYNVSSIVVPSSCSDFKITLKHTGTLPVASMGHDVVITKKSDMAGVDADGAAAGLDKGYVKPDDPRVIAHTKLIGGGETTSVSFPVSKINGDGPYVFFCSFPGHSVLMHGPISVQ
ncbi:MAG TPA: azurin [Rhodanobacteraceae bacterium]|nr:azurin [Rhodanobacteraceae bacterium]